MIHSKKIARLRDCMWEVRTEKAKAIWDETMVALLEGVSESDERILKPVLQMVWEHTHANKRYDRWGECSKAQNIIIPAVRRIYDNFPIRNLVGVQPITELVGTVYSLEYRFEDVDTGEMLTPDEKAALPEPPDPFQCTHKMAIQVIGNKVEVGARKLNGTYTPVTDEDISHMNGLDVECEKIQALSQEIRADITNEVLCDLKALGGEPEVVNLESDSSEQILTLGCRIRANCSGIAMNTRRGAGNWIVVSKTMAKLLSKEQTAKIELKDDYASKHSEMLEVGTLNDTIRIFVANVPDDEILIGYKGGNGEVDTGYFYCPHTAMMSGGWIIEPVKFSPLMNFHTRYGKFTTKNVKAYYRNIKVEGDILKK